MLSKCFHEQGFTVMPIDHQQNRFHPLAKICNLSLTLESSWKYLHWLVVTFTVLFCHAAPPCGTCSRARELPGGPPPLRNEAYPWGFDDLTPEQSARVEAANSIYRGLAVFVELLISLGIYFAIENPANSLLWLLPIWDKILKHAFFVTFDACVYGGSRKTAKTFLTNVPTLKAMAQRCNGGHFHLPFGRQKLPSGKFAYRQPLKKLPIHDRSVFRSWRKFVPPSTLNWLRCYQLLHAGSARLPRGRKVPPLAQRIRLVY